MLKGKWGKQKKKNCEIILQKVEMYKEKQNVEKYKKKSSKKKDLKKDQVKIKILHMIGNDPWSDHPKTQFLGLFILFLFKPEPGLCYVL